VSIVNQELIVERLFQSLITGDRAGARQIITETRTETTCSADDLSHEIYWSVLDMVNNLFRNDQLTTLAHHYAVRILRSLIDQAQCEYAQSARRGRKVCMFSGSTEADELAGQMTADLVEADGYEVLFGGGGVANDEILAEIGEQRPDILLMWASAPSDAPNIRQLIDTIRGVNACPNMQIVVGGGVFNRAPGLAEEIGADLWAKTPRELIDCLKTETTRRASEDQRTVGRNRKVQPLTQANPQRRAAAA
jgi:methanogenic corrinoid protein MtbC1